jgi:hexosaminidase
MVSRIRIGAFIAAWLFPLFAGATATPSLLPQPLKIDPAPGHFRLADGTALLLDAGHPEEQDIAAFLADLLLKNRAIHLAAPESRDGAGAIRLHIHPKREGETAESYRLEVSKDGVQIDAPDAAGLLHGAVTLWQLATQDSAKGAVEIAGVTIADQPRFAWRGLMIDSARHFQSVDYIKHFLDWMAIHKLNILHWHLTDDQGWRIEIKAYPRLTSVGAWRHPAGAGKSQIYGGFYSQDQIREVVAYAAARQITILPEIDMPGHATAAIAAYPELGVAPVTITEASSDWGVFPNLLNVEDSNFTFIDKVIGEMADLFPSPYFHVGGDEAVKTQWKNSPAVQARMKALGIKDEEALQGWFMTRVETILHQHGRKMIGWDETLEGGLAPDATVMSWRGIKGAIAAAKAGHDTILSPDPMLYLDHRQSESPLEPPGRYSVLSVKDIYDYDPLPAELDANERRHVLGLQANLWTEHMRTEEFVTRMAFPRAAALAETGWSSEANHQWASFARRLPAQRARYRALGLEDDHPPSYKPGKRRYSQDLKLCSDKVAISLEDDAPLTGPRARFLVDIMDPCWIESDVDLTKGLRVNAAVGQLPFNFQIGDDKDKIRLRTPKGPDGELELHRDRCDGPVIARLPLTPAMNSPAVTRLAGKIVPQSGRHDLCFTFTSKTLDPFWVLDWVELEQP